MYIFFMLLGYKEPKVLTPDKIAHVTQNAKIIFIMREPVSRLWSDYKFWLKNQKRKASPDEFHRLVTAAIKWWKKCVNVRYLYFLAIL